MALDRDVHGTTEVRVHGVSGTPPDSVLQMPPAWVRLVHGGAASGFYRRWLPGPEKPPSESGVDRVEAYSWGGLTSGSASRSLWLLVLPFTLVDIAHWMMPLLPPGASGARRRVAWVSLMLLRLLSLSLTLTGLVAFAEISLDLAGWQCGGINRCAKSHAYLGWLTGLDRPEQRVAASAILPAVILLLVWLIGRSRISRDSAPDPVVEAGDLPLAAPTFFHVDPGVVRLRRFHVIAAACLLAGLVLAPLVRYADNDQWATGLLVAALVLGGISVLATCSQALAGRGGKDAGWANIPTQVGQGLAVLILVVALVTGFVTHTGGEPTVGHLPGLRGVIIGIFAVQLALVPLLLGTVALQHENGGVRAGAMALIAVVSFAVIVMLWWASHHINKVSHDRHVHVPHGVYTALILVGVCFAWVVIQAFRRSGRPVTFVTPTDTPGPTDVPPAAAGGLGAPLVAAIAWLYSLALCAGVGLQVAQLLGHPVTSTADAVVNQTSYESALDANNLGQLQSLGDTPLIVPPGYIWAALGVLVVAGIAIALLTYVLVRYRKRRAAALEEATHDYRNSDDLNGIVDQKTRAHAIASLGNEVGGARALASLVDDAGIFAGLFVSATLVAGFALLVGYLHYGDQAVGSARGTFAGVGSWFIVAFVGALLGVGYASLRNRQLRRSVGILWDVCTFWPRANHPFTPPPYTECAVPDLIHRVTALTSEPTDRAVLSAHSQGSVIAIPVVLRLDPEHAARVCLLLHGSPVSRLYARWFPAYFSKGARDEVSKRLPGRWRTLYRRTDYIGGWNITRDTDRAARYLQAVPVLAPDDRVDQEVPDPPITGGPARRHSDYWLEPVYTATVAHLLAVSAQDPEQTIDLGQGDTSLPTASMSDD